MSEKYRMGEVRIIPTSYENSFIESGLLEYTMQLNDFDYVTAFSSNRRVAEPVVYWTVLTPKGLKAFDKIRPFMEKENIDQLKVQGFLPKDS